jgi:hypothetical protein
MASTASNRRLTLVIDPELDLDLRVAGCLDGCSKADVARRALLSFIRFRKKQCFDEHPRWRPDKRR